MKEFNMLLKNLDAVNSEATNLTDVRGLIADLKLSVPHVFMNAIPRDNVMFAIVRGAVLEELRRREAVAIDNLRVFGVFTDEDPFAPQGG